MAKLMSRRRFTKVVISDKLTINRRNFSGAPVLLAQNSAAAESEGGQKFLLPNPFPFCPPERLVWRAKRAVSSVQKRFGFRQIIAPAN